MVLGSEATCNSICGSKILNSINKRGKPFALAKSRLAMKAYHDNNRVL